MAVEVAPAPPVTLPNPAVIDASDSVERAAPVDRAVVEAVTPVKH
jgi:hypothetical protein